MNVRVTPVIPMAVVIEPGAVEHIDERDPRRVGGGVLMHLGVGCIERIASLVYPQSFCQSNVPDPFSTLEYPSSLEL